jgi:hypothetical protein
MTILEIVSVVAFWLMLSSMAACFVNMLILFGHWIGQWRIKGLRHSGEHVLRDAEYELARRRIVVSMITLVALFFLVAALKPAAGLISAWYSVIDR